MKRSALIASFILSLTAAACFAETVYIGDQLYVPLRSGPGGEFRIINRALKTGTPLTLMSDALNEGYYHVQTTSGQEGYIPEQYIQRQQPAAERLKTAQAKNQQLHEQLGSLQNRLQEMEQQDRKTNSALKQQASQSASLSEELQRIRSISGRSLELDRHNKELLIANEQLLTELQTLQNANQTLSDDSTHRWYLYGAGTLFGGLLLGLILPSLRPRRKPSGWQ